MVLTLSNWMIDPVAHTGFLMQGQWLQYVRIEYPMGNGNAHQVSDRNDTGSAVAPTSISVLWRNSH